MKRKVIDNPNEGEVEQMTKMPPPTKEKIKDPKKFAAGKKLAEYNRRAKEKMKVVEKNEKIEEESPVSYSFLPETSLMSIIALLGLGLTAIDLFLRYKQTKTLPQPSPWIDPQTEVKDHSVRTGGME